MLCGKWIREELECMLIDQVKSLAKKKKMLIAIVQIRAVGV